MTVNEESLGFGPMLGLKKQSEDVCSPLREIVMSIFHHFLWFNYEIFCRLIDNEDIRSLQPKWLISKLTERATKRSYYSKTQRNSIELIVEDIWRRDLQMPTHISSCLAESSGIPASLPKHTNFDSNLSTPPSTTTTKKTHTPLCTLSNSSPTVGQRPVKGGGGKKKEKNKTLRCLYSFCFFSQVWTTQWFQKGFPQGDPAPWARAHTHLNTQKYTPTPTHPHTQSGKFLWMSWH